MTDHAHEHHDHGTATSHPAPVASDGDAHWDEWYAAIDRVWSGRPNGALVAEVDGVQPGRVLDVGCGEGADAVWLASRGWEVTALDVSAVALDRARAAAADAGVTVTWLHAGLLDAPLPGDGFDLVSLQYPALGATPEQDAERALLATVTPGGTLLAVFHADAEAVGTDSLTPEDYVGHDHLVSLLDERWEVETDERRPRDIRGGSGAEHVEDLVLKARRLT